MRLLLELPDFPEVKGVCVGQCVKGSYLRHRGHAHNGMGDEWKGWICVRRSRVGKFTLSDETQGFDGEIYAPGRTTFHEIAHVRSGSGHDGAWKAEMRKLGQPVPRRYSRRPTYYTWRLSCGCQVKTISPRKKRFVTKCSAHSNRRTFTTESLLSIERALV